MGHKLRVQKYGGSSLDSLEKIKKIASQVAQDYRSGDCFILIVSAMGKTTNQFMEMAHEVSAKPNQRELDMLLTAGERITMALLGLALHEEKIPCISFTGSQAGIMTCGTHGDADILEVKPLRVEREIKKNVVVIVAGFQGVDPLTKEITTLGRGGSDTTAIALAAHFNCEKCEFKKDVEGVYAQDPHQHPQAQQLPFLTWDEVIELTEQGSSFLHIKAARMAKRMKMPLEISHAHKAGGQRTWVGAG